MRVLQCGYSKSGNYLLHRVIEQIQESHGLFRSFVERSGVGQTIDALCPRTKRMPDARRVDNWKLVDGRWHVQFPDMRARWLPLDWELALRHTSLVWSHDTPGDLVRYERDFTHRVYVLRDGRDVVNSMLHYLVTPAILALYPDHRFTTIEQIYAELDFFASKVVAWRDHVRSLLRHRDRWLVVRFEDLVAQREREIARIAVHLGLDVDVAAIAANTSFDRMHEAAPRHLREGKSGDWRRWFTQRHGACFDEIAGQELRAIGYGGACDSMSAQDAARTTRDESPGRE
ncbi:MAG: hypothetical protein DCC71_18880 [Proteobacteria bacterium]|nr:MAG: hypothetical protein DCC71_18880 [Pseudomonadota bacterium]